MVLTLETAPDLSDPSKTLPISVTVQLPSGVPNKYAPGGGTDIIGRIFAPKTGR